MVGTDRTAEIAEFLSHPEAYPAGTERVERIETHISWVFLAGAFAYKVKKPVRFDFLDFSTLKLRERDCRRELRLNRRLAPDVYLEVVPITASAAGTLALGGSGEPVEYAVRMRRLDAAVMLDRLAEQGALAAEHIERLLDVLGPFYESAPTNEKIARQLDPEAIEDNLLGNFKVLREWLGPLPAAVGREPPAGGPNGEARGEHRRPRAREFLALDARLAAADSAVVLDLARCESAQLQYLRLRPGRFEQRQALGRVRDGHGDLRVAHVCMTDPPRVFDCIEFNDRLRYNDVVDELCFLAMDLDVCGQGERGRQLIEGYQRRTGDCPPPDLIAFYKSYRACVRSKVAALRALETTGAARAESSAEAARFLHRAAGYAGEFYRPRLITMVGLMGSGKSTLAQALAKELGTVWIPTDRVRKELAGHGDPKAAYGRGLYSEEMNRRTYDEMFRRAAGFLAGGASVLLDGTFKLRADRDRARAVAQRAGCDWLFIECTCPASEAIARLDRRQRTQRSMSDARPELYDDQVREYQPPVEIDPARLVVADTRASVPDLVRGVIRSLAAPSG